MSSSSSTPIPVRVLHPHAESPAGLPVVELPMSAIDRRRVRRLVEAPDGVVFALELPTGTILHPGQLLHHDAEAAYVVSAADEDVLVVYPRDLAEAARVGHSDRQHASRHPRERERNRRARRRRARRTPRSSRCSRSTARDGHSTAARPESIRTDARPAAASAVSAVRLAVSGRRVCALGRTGDLRAGGCRSFGAETAHGLADFPWLGRAELAAASLAWSAAPEADADGALAALARLVSAHKVIPSVHDTSVRLGRRTLSLLERLHPNVFRELDIDPPHHAVVIGAAGQRLGLPRRELLVAFAHSLIAASVATATRCMPVSPAQGQELIVEFQPALETAVARAMDATADDLFTCTPALDIRCHQQGGLTTRLFQS